MSEATRRYMRLLVFFDLPVTTREKRRIYTVFRRFLIQDGYDMIQWSVYGRLVNGFDDAEKHMKRLSSNLPKEGSIRCLQVSEKQFASMKLLVGTRSFQEKKVNAQQMLLF
jgi:CRISPR-associated protein Cas2